MTPPAGLLHAAGCIARQGGIRCQPGSPPTRNLVFPFVGRVIRLSGDGCHDESIRAGGEERKSGDVSRCSDKAVGAGIKRLPGAGSDVLFHPAGSNHHLVEILGRQAEKHGNRKDAGCRSFSWMLGSGDHPGFAVRRNEVRFRPEDDTGDCAPEDRIDIR